MENIPSELHDDLATIRDPNDYGDVFDRINAAFMGDVDEHIGKYLKLAATRDGQRQKPTLVKKELKRLKATINNLSDDAWIFITQQIEDAYPNSFVPFDTELDRIQEALEEEYVRPDSRSLAKQELCRLLLRLNVRYIIPTTSRDNLVAIISAAVGVKFGRGTFRHCMERRPRSKPLSHPY